MPDRYLESLVCPLPEDIAHLKGAGEFELAIRVIDRRLKRDLPRMLRKRLETEKMFLQRLPRCYTLSHADFMAEMREAVSDFTEDELEEMLLDGKLDFVYINGKRMYHEDTVSSLLKTQQHLNKRANKPYDQKKSALNDVIARVKAGAKGFRFTMRATTTIRDHVFSREDVYRVHLPIPAVSMQQTGAENLRANWEIGHVDPEDAPQRTVCFEKQMAENEPLITEYTFVQRPRYVDPLDESIREIIYPAARPVCGEDLCEQYPHIVFTPYLKDLAKELRGDETDPVRIAYRFYCFATKQVMYAYQRPYLLIENAAEYTASQLRGDCGLYALMFISLCRISGIPARWQSGLYAAPGDVGSHDWAEFYSERLGWLPVDCSFGGGALRAENPERWQFYFGNLDPWRMVANRMYFMPLTPEKKFPRYDPYDSQRAEIETQHRGLVGGEFRTRYEITEWEELTE